MEYVSLEPMERRPVLDAMDRILGCACVQWSTEDEIDHTVKKEQAQGRTEKLELMNDSGQDCFVQLTVVCSWWGLDKEYSHSRLEFLDINIFST